MILEDNVFLIGKILKTHSLYGEVVCELSRFDVEEELEFLIICVDDIYVPFYIEEIRTKNAQSILIKFENVDSEKDARALVGKQVYLPIELKPEFDEENATWDDVVDFAVCDEKFGLLGNLVQVDESTMNVLLVVDGNKGEILIPATEDFVHQINYEQQVIFVDVPEELIDLSKADADEE